MLKPVQSFNPMPPRLAKPAAAPSAPQDSFAPSKKCFPWGRATLAALALAALPLTYNHFTVKADRQITVVMMQEKAIHPPWCGCFRSPVT